jgi:DNA-directed RNA polymerase specialized sigma24 family protein
MDDTVTFEDFVNARSQALLRYGYVLTGDPHAAADLVQEALIRLRGAWSRIRDKNRLEGYVRTDHHGTASHQHLAAPTARTING